MKAWGKGHWLPRAERFNGMKLRIELFNMLDGNWWGYHGDIDTPAAIEHTIYDRIETRRDIERDFGVRIRKDRGHPSHTFKEWTKRCGECGSLPVAKRKRLKAPRAENGRWNSEEAAENIKKMNKERGRLLIPRRWSRWRGLSQGCTYSYWELQYPPLM